MTLITLQDGKVVLRDGKVGTEQACCCEICSGPCDDSDDCAPGCVCVDGECVAADCTVSSFAGFGWYTTDSLNALFAFLSDAGYEQIRFTPQESFPGADPNYVTPCGYTFGVVEADCCGVTGDCDPATITRNIVVGSGGNFLFDEPCQGVDRTDDVTLTVCCPFP